MRAVDIGAVVVTTSGAVALLSLCIAVLAWRAADPLEVRRISALAKTGVREIQDDIAHLRDVEMVRIEAACNAILESAELRFDSAERKRKKADATNQRIGVREAEAHLDPALSDGDRRAALRAHMKLN